MKKLITIIGLLIISSTVFADRIDKDKDKDKAQNNEAQKITIQHKNGIWWNVIPVDNRVHVAIKVIPVSEAAFDHLASLDKAGTYSCTIGKATIEKDGTDPYWEKVVTTYYALQINCN